MIVDAPPIDEDVLHAWLDATDTDDRFGREPTEKPVRARPRWLATHWAWPLAAVAFVGYTIAGAWMLYGADYAIGDALARAASARAIAHSRDPHLMAIGFYWMPLPAMAEVPFMAMLSRLGLPGLGLVMPTAFATSLTLPIIARIGRDLEVRRRTQIAIVVVFALNPYTIFCAGNGMSEAWQVLALCGCFASYLRWTQHRRVRDLGRLGLWLAMAQMTRYESITVVLVFAVLVGWQSGRGRRIATAAIVAAPAAFAVLAWTVTAYVIVGHGWWVVIREASQPNIRGFWLPDERTVATVSTYSAKLSLRFAPGIVFAAAFAGFGREFFSHLVANDDRPPLRATALIAVGALFPAQIAFLLLSYNSFGDPRYYMPLIAIFALLSLVALGGSRPFGWRGAVLVAFGILGGISSFLVLESPRISTVTGEPVMIDALLGRVGARDDVPVDSRIDTGDWRAFVREIDRRMGPDDVVIVDTSVAPAVQLFSANPTRVATERDTTTERELQLTTPVFTYAVIIPPKSGDTKAAGVINSSIAAMTAQSSTRHRWVKVELESTPTFFRGTAELWQRVENPPQPANTSPATSTAQGSPSASDPEQETSE